MTDAAEETPVAKKDQPKGGGKIIPITDENYDQIVDGLLKALDMKAVNLDRGGYVSNSVHTGALSLDLILGGGWPGGRWSVAFGPEGSGKSTLSFFAIASAIRQKVPVFHFDYEGAADPSYMTRIKVKIDWLKEIAAKERVYYRYIQPETGEQVFRFIHRMLQRLPDRGADDGIPAMFVIDSLPFMTPERRYENDESSPMAQQAKMFADNIGLIRGPLRKKNCVLYAVNQIRMRPGVTHGNPEYEPGGETPRFASDLRLRVSKRAIPHGKGPIEEEPHWTGKGTDRYIYSIMRTIKNRGFSPFRETWMRIWFEEAGMPGRGIDPVYDTYQYLNMTGQLTERKGYLNIGVDGFKGDKRITWEQFKALIIDPAARKEEGTNIRQICRAQFPSNEAFERYFSEAGGKLGERAATEAEEEEATDKKAEEIKATEAEKALVTEPKKGKKGKAKPSIDPEADEPAAEG